MEILLDTDLAMGTSGGDPEDGFALLLALNSPELDLKAVTSVFGNAPLDQCYSCTTHLLELLDRKDLPLGAGMAGPLVPERRLDYRQRRDLLVPPADAARAEHHAVDLIISTVMESTSGVTLVAIGPLTNIAMAILREPRIVDRAAGLVIMGGAAVVPGNMTPCAEFNIFADPEAAHIVFHSGLRVRMVGLDVCHQTSLDLSYIKQLEQGSPLGQVIFNSIMPWYEIRQTQFDGTIYLYDSLAVALTFKPELGRSEACWVDVETKGTLSFGETVAYLDAHARRLAHNKINSDVFLDVDAGAFDTLFRERVLMPLTA
jgi:inosine-uridine nucleoside N-ribohydrolase